MLELDNLNNSEHSDNAKEKLEEISRKLVKVDELYNQQRESYTTLYNTYTEIYNVDQQVVAAYNNENFEIDNINKKISLFNQDKCPTCGTSFDSDEFKAFCASQGTRVDYASIAHHSQMGKLKGKKV